jgi:glycerol-3-phosphate acyltransferase PlsY
VPAAVGWALVAFVSGEVPWAVWLTRLVARADIRSVGDSNPGGANAWKVGGWQLGALVLVLDFLKGALPVYLAIRFGGVERWGLTLVGIAPVLGHAFTPLLKFRGGKALATTVGIWTPPTSGLAFLLIFFCLGVGHAVQKVHVWSVAAAVIGMLVLLTVRYSEPPMLTLWAANLAIIAFKHKTEMRRGPEVRDWMLRVLRKA